MIAVHTFLVSVMKVVVADLGKIFHLYLNCISDPRYGLRQLCLQGSNFQSLLGEGGSP